VKKVHYALGTVGLAPALGLLTTPAAANAATHSPARDPSGNPCGSTQEAHIKGSQVRELSPAAAKTRRHDHPAGLPRICQWNGIGVSVFFSVPASNGAALSLTSPGGNTMRKGNGPARRHFTLIAAAAVAVFGAAALAAPSAAKAAPAAHAAPAGRAALLAAIRHEKPVQLGAPDAWIDGAALCLTKAASHCLAISGNETGWWLDLQPAGTCQELWDVFKNAQNDVTFESAGNTCGSGGVPHLCIAAADINGNNRVYLTSNCFGNDFASWYMSPDADNGHLFYNVYSLNQGVYEALSVLNTRTGAFVYVEPPVAPYWQNWNFYSIMAGTPVQAVSVPERVG